MQNSYNTHTPKVVGALVIATIVIAGAYVFVIKSDGSQSVVATTSNPTTTSVTTTNTTSTRTVNSTTPTTATTTLKDGTYTAQVTYNVPHEQNSIAVTVTIKDGVITSVNDQHNYQDRESSRYISSFDQSISGAVVGKKISDTSLSRVGGATLTTDGFVSALQDIVRQAQA